MNFLILIIIFNSSFLWRTKSEQLETLETTQENPTPESISNTNQNLDAGMNSIKRTIDPRRPNLFQKIRVPEGGPYCYPEILNRNVHDDESLRRKTRLAYSPQQRDESHELMEPSYPKGIIENVWPYEKGQTEKKREILQYVRLNISPDLQDNADYRLIGKAAERAFISRYYGFINPTESQTVDDLIRFIEDTEKMKTHLALETGFDPLAEFNSWNQSKRLEFCEKYIDYSTILFQLNIDFDSSRPDEIIREQKHVRYKNPILASIIDTVNVVKCPCIDISTNTTLELGVLPVTYKYQQDFEYAFIYNYLEDDPSRSDKSGTGIGEVKVRALTKIDVEGIKEQRGRAEPGLIHKILAPLADLHHHQDSHSSERNISQENDTTEENNDENTDGGGHKILHKMFAPLGNFFRHQNSHSKEESINKQQKITEQKNNPKQQKQMDRFLHLNMENPHHHQNSNSKKENTNNLEKIKEENNEKGQKERYKYLNLNMDNFHDN